MNQGKGGEVERMVKRTLRRKATINSISEDWEKARTKTQCKRASLKINLRGVRLPPGWE